MVFNFFPRVEIYKIDVFLWLVHHDVQFRPVHTSHKKWFSWCLWIDFCFASKQKVTPVASIKVHPDEDPIWRIAWLHHGCHNVSWFRIFLDYLFSRATKSRTHYWSRLSKCSIISLGSHGAADPVVDLHLLTRGVLDYVVLVDDWFLPSCEFPFFLFTSTSRTSFSVLDGASTHIPASAAAVV